MRHYPDGLSIREAIRARQDQVFSIPGPRSESHLQTEKLVLRPITVSGFYPSAEFISGGDDPRNWNTYPPNNVTVALPIAVVSPKTGHVEPNALRIGPSNNGRRIIVFDSFSGKNKEYHLPSDPNVPIPEELLTIVGPIPDRLRDVRGGWTIEVQTTWPQSVNLGGSGVLQAALLQGLINLDNLQRGKALTATTGPLEARISAGTTRWFGGGDFVHVPFSPRVTDELYERMVVGYREGASVPIIRIADSSADREGTRSRLIAQGSQILNFERPDSRPPLVTFAPSKSNLQAAHR